MIGATKGKKKMRWEDKLYHDCFALTRKTYVFPQESLHSLAKVLRSPKKCLICPKTMQRFLGECKTKTFLFIFLYIYSP